MRYILLPVFVLVLALPVVAQSPAEILEQAAATYEAQLAAVDDFTVTQRVMGMTSTMYYERRTDGAPGEFDAYQVRNGTLDPMDDEHAGMLVPVTLLREMKTRARLVGTETIDGRATVAVAVDDLHEIADQIAGLDDDAEASIETATFYFDTGEYLLRRAVVEGTIRENGHDVPFATDMLFEDYRTVNGLQHPFLTRMEIMGMEGAMSPEERAEAKQALEQARRQMENMPAEQRAMMEQMMGDQLSQLEGMLEGDSMTMEMVVTELQVNTGRPQ